MNNQEDHQNQSFATQNSSTGNEMQPNPNGVGSYDHNNPLIQKMVDAVTVKVKEQIDPLLLELRKLASEKVPSINDLTDQHGTSTAEIAEDTVDHLQPPQPSQNNSGQETEHQDESHVDAIVEIVLSKMMAEINPLLLELAQRKQEKQPTLGGVTSKLGTYSQTMPQQVVNRVTELENRIKEKISERELRLQKLIRKPPSP
ncbi:hypothetical protein [Agrobacterium vitis]|uniref:hypothetical protein n=1 Tax=Agrobacterium vitis TaxID=373 RepID=UPI0015724392|nr:hypothetical protein [Agrobacterium vitis]NSZ19250.1 hypothetical protein [Agrobacterium vitis]QZO06123.1 hypothetical protein K4831_20955 [Agrobacterium vitis]UJL90446.1 hypothetical protein AVF2S5_20990 [Agrobacterium vitis]